MMFKEIIKEQLIGKKIKEIIIEDNKHISGVILEDDLVLCSAINDDHDMIAFIKIYKNKEIMLEDENLEFGKLSYLMED